jgi:hypothetical protein
LKQLLNLPPSLNLKKMSLMKLLFFKKLIELGYLQMDTLPL